MTNQAPQPASIYRHLLSTTPRAILIVLGAVFFQASALLPAATPAFVQEKDNQITSGQINHVAFSSSVGTGNLIAVFLIWDNTGSASVSDSLGNTYFTAHAPTLWGNNSYSVQTFYASNATGGADTVTATFATPITSFGILYAHEYSGVLQTAPIDVTAAASGTSGSLNSGPVTTTNAVDLLFAGGVSASVVTSPGPGYVARSTAEGNITEDIVVSVPGSYSATATNQQGAWAMQVVAFKAAGGTPDTTPPTVPSGLSVTGTTASTVSLSWTASTDKVGVAGYKVFRSGAQVGTSGTTSYTDTGLAPSTTYSYTVSAYDAAGNNSALTSPVSGTTTNASSGSYSTNFPLTENPVSEGGNWAGGSTAGGTLWGNVQTTPGLAFGVSEPTQFGDPTAILTGTWGPDQTVQAMVSIVNSEITTGTCCHEAELRLRMTISPNNISGYEAYCSVMSSNPYCHIARWNGPNGSYCNIESSTPSIYLVNGDVIKAIATGTNPTTVTMYRNGIQIVTATDTGQDCSPGGAAGPFLSGNPGIGFYDDQGDSKWSDFGFSNFSATDGTTQDNFALSATPASQTVTAGGNATYTVTVTPSGSFSGAVTLSAGGLPSGTTASFNPASITTSGSSTMTLASSGSTPAGTYPITIKGTSGSLSQTASATLVVSTSGGTSLTLACNPASLGPNASSTCTVTLSQAAPSRGATVALTSTNAALTVPPSVTVRARATTATFSATTTTIAGNQSATITATYSGSSANAVITLVASVLVSSLSCNPATLGPNASSTCTVTLTQAAPTGGSTVAISDNNAALTTPGSVTVAAGSTRGTFSATTGSFTGSQSVTVTASLNGNYATTTITLTAGAPVITSSNTASGVAGTAFSYQITATNSPSGFAANGLPAGLTVNSTTGLISGTPTGTGTYTITLSATNSSGTGSATLTLTVVSTYFVQTVSTAAPNNSNSLSLAFKNKTVAGNLILVAIDFMKSVPLSSLSDSQGNTWTQVGTQLNSPNGIGSRIYYANNIKGGSDTVTVTLSGTSTYLEMYLTEYAGLNQANPIDAQTGTTGTGGTVSSGNITTTLAGDLLYTFCLADSSCTVSSGFTARSTLNGNYLGDKIAGNPGTYSATGTASAGWSIQLVALKPASPVLMLSAITPQLSIAPVTRGSRGTPAQGVSGSNGLSGLSCSPRAVNPGSTAICELRMTASATAVQLALASSSDQVKVPATVTTRPNQSSLTFQAFVEPAAKHQTAGIRATLNGSQVQETILVMPASGPVLRLPERRIARFGEPVSFTVSAVDSEGLPVQVSIAGTPAGASFDAASGRFDWTPSAGQTGKHQVTFTAVNGLDQTAKAQTTIDVDSGQPSLSSSQQLSCSPNALASLTGKWLAAPGTRLSDPTGSTRVLGGTRAKVNEQYVPILFGSPGRVDFLCPALEVGTELSVAVVTGAQTTEPLQATMQEASPRLLSVSFADSADRVMMRNYLVPAHPAQPGDQILLWTTGLGSGSVLVKVGDIAAGFEGVDAVPGNAGLYAVRARIPAGTQFGDAVPVQVQVTAPSGRQYQSNTIPAAVEPVRQ